MKSAIKFLSFSALMGIVLTSCTHNYKPKTTKVDSLPKRDTIVAAYIFNNKYNLGRALRTIQKTGKIVDSAAGKFEWVVDTSYIVEVPVDTSVNAKKSFTAPATNHTPGFWPLILNQ